MHRRTPSRPGPARTAVRAVAAAGAGLLTLSACGGGLGSADGDGGDGGDTLTIGYVTPQSGPLAAFGEADSFVVDQMTAYFADNPLEIGGTSYDVEIVVKDTQSDSVRAGEVTAELINDDGADLVLAASTPDTVNPVADQCEANGVPCITTAAPWQPYFFGRGGTEGSSFDWTYHFFWGLEDVEAVYQDMWSQVDTNRQAGALWPNDPDGNAWSADFPGVVGENGYSITDPGLYENGTQDYSAQISAFQAADDQILLGVPIPPDFATFWQQAQQQGYTPRIATVAKALLFPSAVEAIGDSADGLCTEVWWSPQHPFTSSLTGQSAQELADAYEEATGRQWTQPIGFVHALFEVAVAALTEAGSTDGQAVVDALSSLQVSTIAGDLDWTSGPVPNVAKTPLVGGQWRASDGGEHPFDLVVVSNSEAPEIPTAGTVEPLG
ncbi:ABC transporter substrate-binding protein [Klenkia brasiliensis]|uniref:Branched-chain amino acid transport system substrate-binding protein n=1 Tax=Klenkia brasiliensis TaxID=333142 RepID=A0A1G7WFM2_9ACTN|nr:ABC transporter substrate-binding protein [Klenkia brasiliensis]SDG70664.1 branched-chain amino acid transport system substrate-binding protein [Klenkia brasiliensis]